MGTHRHVSGSYFMLEAPEKETGRRRLVFWLILIVAMAFLAALGLLAKKHSGAKVVAEPRCEIHFLLTKDGHVRPSVVRRTSMPLVLGEETTEDQWSVDMIFAEGEGDTALVGYHLSFQNDGSTKVWVSVNEKSDEWLLNAESNYRGEIKVFLDVESGESGVKNNSWILRKGMNRRPLLSGKLPR